MTTTGFWVSAKRIAIQWILRLCLVLVAILLGLAALEIGLRVIPSEASRVTRRDRPLVAYYPSGNRLNAWSRNHPDPLRIAIVGDSITRGAGCQFYDTYGMRLEALLNHNDDQRPAKIRIWAEGGDSTHSQLRYIESILEWEPELLILGICLNDTEDPIRSAEYRQWRLKALPPPPPRMLAAVLPYTRAGSMIYQKYASSKAKQGYHEYYRRLYDVEYSGWRRFVQALRQFDAVCREQEIAFVPVIFPMFNNVDRYPFGWIHDQIGDVLREEGIVFLDLLGTFRGQSPYRLQAIPYVDPHPNEIAHRQAAESIFQFLLANELIDAGYMPQHASASPTELWRLLDRFVHRVDTITPEEYQRLIEPEEQSGDSSEDHEQ